MTGTVTKAPEASEYFPGETVTLTAPAITDWAFDHWEGDLTGEENPAELTMDSH